MSKSDEIYVESVPALERDIARISAESGIDVSLPKDAGKPGNDG